MAAYLGGKFRPESGYENDVCIYILGSYRYDGPEVRFAYYDVMDCGMARLQRIRRRTKGALISVSRTQFDNLRKTFPGRKVYFIPQHHCNFKREVRPDRPVATVGCCGGDAAVQWPHDRVKELLSGMGLSWEFCNELQSRKRVVEFYKKLDIQIVYRPTHNRGNEMIAHSNPLKLSNAGSFGIPTVAYPEPSFTDEWKDECLYSDGMEGLMRLVEKLKDDRGFYGEMSDKAKAKSEEYHIDNIAPLYRQLPNG